MPKDELFDQTLALSCSDPEPATRLCALIRRKTQWHAASELDAHEHTLSMLWMSSDPRRSCQVRYGVQGQRQLESMQGPVSFLSCLEAKLAESVAYIGGVMATDGYSEAIL